MCGVVCYFGPGDGVRRVQEALQLLEYRAPDSAGLAALAGPDGELVVRRVPGPPDALAAALAADPMFPSPPVADGRSAADLLASEGLGAVPLRDLAGRDLSELQSGLRVGAGDRGASSPCAPAGLSRRLRAQLGCTQGGTPDFDRDAVRHAFRLLAAHVAAPAEEDARLSRRLDEAFLARVRSDRFDGWRQAWRAEWSLNVAGQAFAVASRSFQESFPGLARLLVEDEWERVGGATAAALPQVILGHGRLAVVGEPSEVNSHPFPDRAGNRAVCENGTHSARLYLGLRREQEDWWRARGVSSGEAVHRSGNTTEVLVYEWERTRLRLDDGELTPQELEFVERLEDRGIADPEEQALRLTLHRVEPGSAHACVFYSRSRPGVLYVSSHRRPIVIGVRTEGVSSPEIMVASDLNAVLMLWPGEEVDAAADRLAESSRDGWEGSDRASKLFPVEGRFLDGTANRGRRLLATIGMRVAGTSVEPAIHLTTYEGAPLEAGPRTVPLSPEPAVLPDSGSFAESHLAETPAVTGRILRAYLPGGALDLEPVDGVGHRPGLRSSYLVDRFGAGLEGLNRLLLVGEGSSWRAAQAVALAFRRLLPGRAINVYRPIELLNVGETVDPAGDLAVELSWSGTTASVLEVDDAMDELGVSRLAITGRPSSDLGRRTMESAGTLHTLTGVEISVPTMKSYPAVLLTGILVAARLAEMEGDRAAEVRALVEGILPEIPVTLDRLVRDEPRRTRLQEAGERRAGLSQAAVVGSSPADWEGALKLAKATEGVAVSFGFRSASVRALIDRASRARHDGERILFVVNASDPRAEEDAGRFLAYLVSRGVPCILHATSGSVAEAWRDDAGVCTVLSPALPEPCQPLVDHVFFSQLALALAGGRDPRRIDRPRHLVKSVTGTGVERRIDVERRRPPPTPEDFVSRSPSARPGSLPSSSARLVAALEMALAATAEDPEVALPRPGQHLVVSTESEAAENGVRMAAGAWQELLGVDVVAYRRFAAFRSETAGPTVWLRVVRVGAVPAVPDPHTISLPTDLGPFEVEAFTAARLSALAVRAARARGADLRWWEEAVARVPDVAAGVLGDGELRERIRRILAAYVPVGYDKVQVVGGGQDYAAGRSLARCLRMEGFMAETVYSDSAEHGPLVAVGGPDPARDALVVVLGADPLFQDTALADVQAYRARGAPVLLVVAQDDERSPVVADVGPSAVIPAPVAPRPILPLTLVPLIAILTEEMGRLRRDR